MKRRTLVSVAVGAMACAAGASWAWWRAQGGAHLPPQGFWSLAFDSPEGGRVALTDMRGKPLLVNFWATWCAPCVKEMPLLDRIHRVQAARGGLHVLGLAVDGPTPVREYLRRTPMSFPVGLAGLDGTQLARDLGNLQGGLPFSVLLDRNGLIVARRTGALDEEELNRWAERFAT